MELQVTAMAIDPTCRTAAPQRRGDGEMSLAHPRLVD
jgi:hypothetical protein